MLKIVPDGVDVVFDPVGGDSAYSMLRCMRVGAALLSVGYASKIPSVSFEHLMQRNVCVTGVFASGLQFPAEMEDSAQQVVALWRQGLLTPDTTCRLRVDQFRNGVAEFRAVH